jgi:hypothetical protein
MACEAMFATEVLWAAGSVVALESIAQFALVTNGHRLHYTTSWDVIYTGEFHPLLPNLTTSVSPLSLSLLSPSPVALSQSQEQSWFITIEQWQI